MMTTQLDRIEANQARMEAKLDQLLVAQGLDAATPAPRLYDVEAMVVLLDLIGLRTAGMAFSTSDLATDYLAPRYRDEMRDAIRRVYRGQVAPRRLNRFLKQNEGRQIGRWLITRNGADKRACLWVLVEAKPLTRAGA